MRFERRQIAARLAFEADQCEHGDREAQQSRIERRMIPLDRARFLQRPYAAQAGRCGQSNAFGQFDVRHPPVLLQQRQDLPVDTIESHKLQSVDWYE